MLSVGSSFRYAILIVFCLAWQSPHWGRERRFLYFNWIPDVVWLLVFCVYSSGLCSVWLWYFLAILTHLFILHSSSDHHARIQRGTGGNHKAKGFPWQYRYGSLGKPHSYMYQASIERWSIIGTPAKRHLNGVSLAGRWCPVFSGSSLPSSTNKIRKRFQKFIWTPLTKLTSSAHGSRWGKCNIHY